MPLGYWMMNQALCNVRSILNRDPTTTITDGQLYIQFFLPTSSSRSVCRPGGTPVATLTISGTSGALTGGANGPPSYLNRLQVRASASTRGQILSRDKFSGHFDYMSFLVAHDCVRIPIFLKFGSKFYRFLCIVNWTTPSTTGSRISLAWRPSSQSLGMLERP